MSRQSSAFEERHATEDVRGASERAFGRVFAAAFAVIGTWPLIHALPPRWWALVIALGFLAVSVAVPHWLAPLNRAWFRLGQALHEVVSPLVMGAIFFLVVTPIAVIRRWRGADPLRLRAAREADSYWVVRDPPGPDPDTLKRQF